MAAEASITVTTISKVCERQHLTDTTAMIILHGVHAMKTEEYLGEGKSSRAKEGRKEGRKRRGNYGLIEWIHISMFLGSWRGQIATGKE